MKWILIGALVFSASAANSPLRFESIPEARFSLGGPVGDRVTRNIDEWLLRAPSANPGMLEMFRLRDRAPAPQLVPWAGEFAGKYLISAVQALRMSDDPRLRAEVERVLRELISTQADDGYLGPFPKSQRLKGNWDLWGHYHCMQALVLWHEQTGDTVSLGAARRGADLICNTFLDTNLRVIDAGSHEMNMAVIHVLGHLHRLTGETRYLRMMREIEKDWERAGDYLRVALAGREFYQSPAPRWESLHDLQGLLELHRITGEAQYRRAFEHHWRSILRHDIHNNGAFSSGEQATGNPYAPGAIETCCTIAWMALSIDMLRLTGDPAVAEQLELTTMNGALGAQHPTGRWWTYNTPMDGVREASAHSIVFQSRAGTPELNCCSVNGPRALGMLSEWTVMKENDGFVLNSYLPGQYRTGDVDFEITGNYPLFSPPRLIFKKTPNRLIRLKLRNPIWSEKSSVRFNGKTIEMPSGYLELAEQFNAGDSLDFSFEASMRSIAGQREATNRISIYRGPILLAYDQSLNEMDERKIPKLGANALTGARIEFSKSASILDHWLEVSLTNGLKLCDYATAGNRGSRYRSWLKIDDGAPAPKRGPGDLLIDAPLKATSEPVFGKLEKVVGQSADNGISLNGAERLTYLLEEFPEDDYTISLFVNVSEILANRLAQIFSAWCAPNDDPLRLVLDKGQLFARIENSGGGSSTKGISFGAKEWHHVAAVKSGSSLRLYIDGQKRAETTAPAEITTNSRAVALGGNPRFTGNEFLKASFQQFKLHARALSETEIQSAAQLGR